MSPDAREVLPASEVSIRSLAPADRPRVEAMTREVGVFRDNEIPVALEVFDGATGFGRAVDPDYRPAGIELNGELAAWAVWGPTPGTQSTFDLYWIVVDPRYHNRGLGSILLGEIERRITGQAGLLVVVTSGREDYTATRKFYSRHGYTIKGLIEDYYGPGDDQVIFTKRFPGR